MKFTLKQSDGAGSKLNTFKVGTLVSWNENIYLVVNVDKGIYGVNLRTGTYLNGDVVVRPLSQRVRWLFWKQRKMTRNETVCGNCKAEGEVLIWGI